jgi:hypothetical protein
MRSLVSGCFLFLVVVGIAVAGLLYVGYRNVRPYVESVSDLVGQVRSLEALGDAVANRSPFTAPVSGELTAAQVRRFIAVQREVQTQTGTRWTAMSDRLMVWERDEHEGAAPPPGAKVNPDTDLLLSQLGQLMYDTRVTQVAGMNAQQFSVDEYAWVRRQVYAAAGLQVAEHLEWREMLESLRRSAGTATPADPASRPPLVPDVNRQLVAPHLESLKADLPYAMLGF